MRSEREALRGERQARTQELETVSGELRIARVERDLLKERVAALMRRFYGAQSEARGKADRQQDLFNEAEALAAAAALAVESKKVAVPAHERTRGGRKPLDAALPREVIRHELPEAERACPHDGSLLREIGVEVSEQLDIVPAKIRVIRHERVKYACPCCDEGVRTAPGPVKLLPKGLLSEGALAWVITAKYQDSLPLYRQAAILERLGGELSRATLASSVVRAGEAVQPMVNLLRDELLEADLILGDETELQVLKEPGRAAQTRSYLWAQMSGAGPPIRLFSYRDSRSAKTALELYQGAKGALLTDGYEVYASVAHANGLTHLGCWAHARRRFVEAEAALPKNARGPEQPATQFIAAIGALYGVEKEARDKSASERTALRGEKSRPALDRIEQLLLAHRHSVLPQSLLGRALHYLEAEWPKLARFVEDGRYPIDNNACENAIRPFVVGRRNWLFADSVGGAQASANLYSLIETAKANGVDAYQYLRALFAALPKATRLEDYEALLPWRIELEATQA
ncbi:MAG: IS66 family transposase [Polyangiaceae bacterium]|nr:IS66 family transposase [Polyangiaceae bacterium]